VSGARNEGRCLNQHNVNQKLAIWRRRTARLAEAGLSSVGINCMCIIVWRFESVIRFLLQSSRVLRLGKNVLRFTVAKTLCKLEMWANAQRDGRSAEYMWRPLFNAAKFG